MTTTTPTNADRTRSLIRDALERGDTADTVSQLAANVTAVLYDALGAAFALLDADQRDQVLPHAVDNHSDIPTGADGRLDPSALLRRAGGR